MLSGCKVPSQNEGEIDVFFHENLRFYTQEEQQQMFLNNVDLFDELRIAFSQSEYTSETIFVQQNRETAEYDWHISSQGDIDKRVLNADIVAVIDSFCEMFHCRSIIWGGNELEISFWENGGNGDIIYLENGPDAESADFYTRLSGHWYYGEFPYDIVY